MGENKQPGLSNATRPKNLKFKSAINDNSLKAKEVFVPPPKQLTNL